MIEFNYFPFPDPQLADKEGLIAIGGDLSADMILSAYLQGIFPWFNSDEQILWWSPDPRMILLPKDFRPNTSLKQMMNKKIFRVSADTCFNQVISNCASVPRKDQNGTWITPGIKKAYSNLHTMGIAHSIEIFENNELVGGLYGLAIGKVFFGESMFHVRRDASKVALYHLCNFLAERHFEFIDVQQSTGHLKSLGGMDIPRAEFLRKLKNATSIKDDYGKWRL